MATMMSKMNGGARIRRQRRDWSSLPPELLQLVSERVSEIGDYVRFGAVCKPWLSSARLGGNLPPQIPWLLLPYDPNDSFRDFFSISSQRTYRFDLASFRGRVISISSEGWLLMSDSSFSLSLLNPITQTHIHLPPLTTILNNFYGNLIISRDRITSEDHGCIAPKTQLLTTLELIRSYPCMFRDGECIVALVIGESQFLYCRVQGNAWIMPDRACLSPIDTLTYHEGEFYIVYMNGEVAVCEIGSEAKSTLIPSLRVPIDFSVSYLVAVSGELLLLTSMDITVEKPHFDYFKMDKAGELKWSRIQDIGDKMFFLTNTDVIAAAAGGTFSCRGNSIFASDAVGRPSVQGLDESIEDGIEHKPHFEEEPDPYNLLPKWFNLLPKWFMPSLC